MALAGYPMHLESIGRASLAHLGSRFLLRSFLFRNSPLYPLSGWWLLKSPTLQLYVEGLGAPKILKQITECRYAVSHAVRIGKPQFWRHQKWELTHSDRNQKRELSHSDWNQKWEHSHGDRSRECARPEVGSESEKQTWDTISCVRAAGSNLGAIACNTETRKRELSHGDGNQK